MYIIYIFLFSDAEIQYEEALKYGSVKIFIRKCLVLGITGVGKTHFKHLLLNLPIPGSIGSTPLSEQPIQALVGSSLFSYMPSEQEEDGSWVVVNKEQLMAIVAGAIKLDQPVPTIQLSSPSSSHTSGLSEVPSLEPYTIPPTLLKNPMTREEADRVLINAFKNPKKGNYQIRLIHFIDSGGQPEFLELLPAFVQDISTAFLTLTLSEPFDHCPEIFFRGHDGKAVGELRTSVMSHKQVFEQCIKVFDVRNVHNIFVIGTHRDKIIEEEKDSQILEMINEKYLKRKNVGSVIWDFNAKEPNDDDRENAKNLRKAVVEDFKTYFTLPLKWFGLELQITKHAIGGVMSYEECLRHAELFGMNEEKLCAALQQMNKFNLFLWYSDVPALKGLVFSDPQVILATITDLVKSKYMLRKSSAPDISVQKFCNNGFVSYKLFDHKNFRERFNNIFTPEYFIHLMRHLCLMAPLEGGDYFLMPAILDPLAYDKILEHCEEYNSVEPLLLCFTTTKCAPYGIFTNLVAFIINNNHGILDVDKTKVPTCLYRNCVSFRYKSLPATFTIVDSFSCIQIYLKSTQSGNVCPDLKDNILNGIEQCADTLKYEDITIQEGFICHECCEVDKCQLNPCLPIYEKDPNTACCKVCNEDRDITECREMWQKGSSKLRSKSLICTSKYKVAFEQQ